MSFVQVRVMVTVLPIKDLFEVFLHTCISYIPYHTYIPLTMVTVYACLTFYDRGIREKVF